MTTQTAPLGERAQTLLKALVTRYIEDGRPVGSRTLSRLPGLDLSPATIRNVMADLEELGFVHAPHTSAGRIPTTLGYRFFVDTLLDVHTPDHSEVDRYREALDPEQEPDHLVTSASKLLSHVTHLVGVVTLPRNNAASLRHIEFLPLSEQRVLAVLVFNTREVQNRIVRTHREMSASELQQISNYLNAQFAGRTLSEVRSALLKVLKGMRADVDRMMQDAVNMAEELFNDSQSREDYVLAGQTNLMEFDELAKMETLRRLFEAFQEKQEILHLLDQCISADGLQIFIGSESGHDALNECSVVTAPYLIDGQLVGVLGVIGPTRIPYDRVIPIVDVTARLLGSALEPKS